jgi:hypothetical protein
MAILGVFWNLSAEHFSKIDQKGLEDDVKLKSDQHESCGEFQDIRFRVKKSSKTESWCTNYAPISKWYGSSFGILKVGNVVDSNSCQMISIQPSHKFGYLWAFLGVIMKVLEVPKSPWIQGFLSDGPSEASNIIYWPEILFFRGTTKSYEIASPLADITKGEGSSTTLRISKEEGGQGGCAPLGPATAGAPCAATTGTLPFTAASTDASFSRAAASPLRGGTSPSSSTTLLHHPYCNLLENVMCGTIYYFPMIYCVYV